MKNVYKLLMLSVLLLASPYALADEPLFTRYTFYGIRYEMIIFALMLVGVAVFYTKTMKVAIIGLLSLCFYKYEFTDGFSVIKKLIGYVNTDGQL